MEKEAGRRFQTTRQLGRRELGDSLGTFRDSMLGKLSRKHKTDSSLDLSARESGLLVVGGKLSSFSGNALKDIIDERVHDGHALLTDSGIRVDLLQHLVDVGRVGLGTLLGLALGASGLLGGLGGLLGGCLVKRGRVLLVISSSSLTATTTTTTTTNIPWPS